METIEEKISEAKKIIQETGITNISFEFAESKYTIEVPDKK